MSSANVAALSRGSNSYDLVRFIAAAMVLYSHHFPLTGRPEPYVPFYGEKYGELAIGIFFSLSGFLIYRSLRKNGDWSRFLAARCLRIMPNLVVVMLLTSLVTMIYFHNTANIFGHIKYAVQNSLIAVFGAAYLIPGVFEQSTLPAANGSLWSLHYEIALYAVLFLVFSFGRWVWVWALAGLVLLNAPVWVAEPRTFSFSFEHSVLIKLVQLFFSGVLLGCVWDYLNKKSVSAGLIGLAGVLGCIILIPAFPHISAVRAICIAAATVGLGALPLMARFGKWGDPSYGMYLLAWPIQQFCIIYIQNFWASMLVAFILTVAGGYLTWNLYEKRCMQQVGRLADIFHRWANRLLRRPVAGNP